MASNIETGKSGEKIAELYLRSKGYQILRKNFRHKRAEIDLVVQKEDTLIFVEVKFRKNSTYGFPEEFVSEAQSERIKEAATNFIEQMDWRKDIRFDIVAISGSEDRVEHFMDAF